MKEWKIDDENNQRGKEIMLVNLYLTRSSIVIDGRANLFIMEL